MHDQNRPSARERGYDSQWAKASLAWRAQFPICGMRADGRLHLEHSECARRGLLNTKDVVVDHIVPMADGGAKFDESNLQTLCRQCNTSKDSGWRRG